MRPRWCTERMAYAELVYQSVMSHPKPAIRTLPRVVRAGSWGLIAILALQAAFPSRGSAQELTVTGRVTDARSGTPVENARLTLEVHGTVLSNSNGEFVFSRVSPGRYRLYVEGLGYEDLELPLTLANDTTLALTLEADPIALDSIAVVLETIDFDGRAVDPHTDSYVYDADVRTDQGHEESTNLFGRFDLDDVFDGVPLRVSIQGFRYLPLDTTFVPDHEERYPFYLQPDPLMTTMIDTYVARLDDRAGRRMYDHALPLNRVDLTRFAENTSLRMAMEARYPLNVLRRVGCFMIDEREYRFGSPEERVAILEGTFVNEIERIELLEFPGYGRLFMVRIYTRRFFQQNVGSERELKAARMTSTPVGPICR